MAQRLRRAEQVERNREVVLEAAREVFISKGYAGATVDAVAGEAGFSTGVVYSQFGSKADLFFALLERRIDERAAQNERIVERSPGVDGVRELLRAAGQDRDAETGWARVLVEFRILASRDRALGRRYAALHRQTIERLAATLERLFDGSDVRPVVPFEAMAEFILAFGSGLTLERAADPKALPDEHVMVLMPGALGLSEGDA